SFKLRRGNLTLGGKLEFPDPERDLCQVHAEGLKAPAVTIAPARSLRVGQKVFTLGAPRALEETISDGLLSALRLDNEGKLRFLQTS
ncbi:serine protease, partial [Acinetobacter baumannii]